MGALFYVPVPPSRRNQSRVIDSIHLWGWRCVREPPLCVCVCVSHVSPSSQQLLLTFFGAPACRACCSDTGAMADLPRWIDDWKVDSGAMLLAYWNTPDIEKEEYYGELTLFIHASPWRDLLPRMRGVHVMHCKQSACRMCSEQRGGFMFRWCHIKWSERYRTAPKKHPNCWLPTAQIGAWHQRDSRVSDVVDLTGSPS